MKLSSVELELPVAAAAQRFFTGVWGLRDAGRALNGGGPTFFVRATGADPYVVALSEASASAIRSITFSGTGEELARLRERAAAAGAASEPFAGEPGETGAEEGFMVRGTEEEVYRFVVREPGTAALPHEPDRPIGLTHVVLNVRDRDAATRFALEALDFRLSDRTRIMSFVRCDDTHHAIAYADAELCSLNHLAFEMVDLDAVMRGIGRMKENGYPLAWGPGRHGPGNNVFAYFVAPFGAVVEYTAEVRRVDERYRSGGPADWKWPPGRGDQWGIAVKDSERMAEAERLFRFRARD